QPKPPKPPGPPNLKLTPPRMMFSLSETLVVVLPQLPTGQEAFCRSTNRYSTLAVQFGANAYSTPAPAVQPVCVELENGSAPAADCTLANAAPPVDRKSTR